MKSAFWNVLIAASVVCGGVAAHAGDDFGQSWPKIIQGLSDRGIKKVGDFDVAGFTRAAKTIKWETMPAAPPSVISGSRKSAYYLRDRKKVVISERLPVEALESLAALELHEALGALGYDDRNYTLSTALNLLSKMESPERREKLKKKYAGGLFKNDVMMYHSDGEGGSSVGGGGDINMLLIKNKVLDRIAKNEKDITSDFLTTYPMMTFEPMYRGTEERIVIHYKYVSPAGISRTGPMSGVLMTNGFQEQIGFWIPMKRWNRGEAERNRMLEELKEKVLGLLPISDRPAMMKASAAFCDRGVKVEFPATDDDDVAWIQRTRAGLMGGCNAIEGSMGMETITPSVPQDWYPAKPGIVAFDCVYRYKGGEQKYIISTVEGRSGIFSSGSGAQEGDFLFGMFVIDKENHLQMIRISYTDPQKNRSEVRADAIDADHATVTMQIAGAPFSYACERRE